MEQDKLYERRIYVIEKLKLLEDDAENTAKTAVNNASEDETSQRSINRPKNIHFCGPLSNFEKSGNSDASKKHIKVPKDFDQLVVSDTDKKTSQLFKYKGLKLEKYSEYDMFYLQSVVDNLTKYGISRREVESFIHTYSFYVQLCLLDDNLQKYGNVYLLMNKEKKTCKVGMSWNIEKRYSKTKRNKELVYVIPVKNMKTTESKLIKHFTHLYGKPVEGNETFAFTNADDVKKEFLKTIDKDVIDIDINKDASNHFSRFKTAYGRRGLWCSFDAAIVIFNYFIEDTKDRRRMTKFMSLLKYAIDRDEYIYTTYNNKLNTEVEFILFHKYRIIRNSIDHSINASSLYNSIKKHGHCRVPYRNIKTLIDSPRFQFRVKQLKRVRPNEQAFYFHENKEQKFLEGYYIHYALVHFLIDMLDSEYAIDTSILIFDIYSGKIKLNLPHEHASKTVNIKELYPDIIEIAPIITGGASDRTISFAFILIVSIVAIVIITIVVTFITNRLFYKDMTDV